MHVRNQLAAKAVAAVREATDLFGDRVFDNVTVKNWDRMSVPACLIKAKGTTSDDEGNADDIQVRRIGIEVSLLEREYEGEDIDLMLGEMQVVVEAAMHALAEDDEDIERFRFVDDTGVVDVTVEADGTHAGVVMSFVAEIYTAAGAADRFITPFS